MGRKCLLVTTEQGRLDVSPGQILLLPRGMRFRVELPDGAARGYVCENHGALFRLPDLGPIGANEGALETLPRSSLASITATEKPAARWLSLIHI